MPECWLIAVAQPPPPTEFLRNKLLKTLKAAAILAGVTVRRLLTNHCVSLVLIHIQGMPLSAFGWASGGLPVMQRDNRDGQQPILTAVFIDYDNIYLSLKRTSEEAAARFAKDAPAWLKAIESGGLITPTNGGRDSIQRRLVMNRCYGNPVPRKNARDNSTDSNSFTFIRHHFLRAGFEVVDCPPLTAQLKNSSDIRMVMDVRDFMTHETHFDEFIILSGDADFTPVLHRLRAHARRTVIFANEHTVAPYKAISDGEIRERDLVEFLLGGVAHGQGADEGAPDEIETTSYAPRLTAAAAPRVPVDAPPMEAVSANDVRHAIIDLVKSAMQSSEDPMPIEVLADRAQRLLGHEHTVATQWAGAGTFRAFLTQNLPPHLAVTGNPPYQVYSVGLGVAIEQLSRGPVRDERPAPIPQAVPQARKLPPEPMINLRPVVTRAEPEHVAFSQAEPAPPASSALPQRASAAPVSSQTRPPARHSASAPNADIAPARRPVLAEQPLGRIEHSIARIHEACQAPPLSPPDYRILFDVMAAELGASGLQGNVSISAIVARASNQDLELKPDDVRYVLDVVREADPWFDQGVSAPIFASRFRNFVVSRCRAQGMHLSVDEIDLIDAWFAASVVARRQNGVHAAVSPPQPTAAPERYASAPPALASARAVDSSDHWRDQASATRTSEPAADPFDEFGDMPRIVRSRVQA